MRIKEILQILGFIIFIVCFFIGVVWFMHTVVAGKNIKCEHGNKKYTIEMTLINGSKTIKTYKFKSCTWFYIETHRGSYSLERHNCESSNGSVVKNAVIDYKIITNEK